MTPLGHPGYGVSTAPLTLIPVLTLPLSVSKLLRFHRLKYHLLQEVSLG